MENTCRCLGNVNAKVRRWLVVEYSLWIFSLDCNVRRHNPAVSLPPIPKQCSETFDRARCKNIERHSRVRRILAVGPLPDRQM